MNWPWTAHGLTAHGLPTEILVHCPQGILMLHWGGHIVPDTLHARQPTPVYDLIRNC